jgi:LysM repeat protein
MRKWHGVAKGPTLLFSPQNSGGEQRPDFVSTVSGEWIDSAGDVTSLLRRTRMSIVESLKPLLLFVVLGGVGYGVYVALNHAPPPELAALAPEWNKPAAEPGSPNGIAGNRNLGGNATSTMPPSNPWQSGMTNNGSAGDASNSVTGPSPMSSMPSGGAVGSLPFGLGSSAAQTPVGNSLPQNQISSPVAGGTLNQSTNVNAAAAGNFAAPISSGLNSSGPNSGMPNSATPDFGSRYSGAMNSGPLNQNMANPGADAQARHDYEASSRTALTLLNQGQLVEALRELSRWYGQAAVPSEDEPRFMELLSQLAGTVIYSRDPWLGPPYQVRAGDSLESIAQQYQVPWQLLAKINGIQNPNGLLPGERLKIVHGPFQAQLNVRQGWLALFVDGLFAGRFRVQASGPLAKPDGAYPVAKFSADQVGAGSSRSPYISLGGDLHLRVLEDALPPGVSAVRISRQDMNDVFDMLSERSQVTIMR